MTRRFVVWLPLALFAVFAGQLPTQLDAAVTTQSAAGCWHNGTRYADKSMVPTTEKCLSCLCSKKNLVCRLKVCPEMPMPPPRGCVVVQKKSTCCPYLSCARLDAFYKIPTSSRIIAYLDHYERESIDRVVSENVLQGRSDDSEVDLYVCIKNGTVYKSGSAMSSSNLCSYCYCIGGTEKCVKPKCMLPVEGCKPIFVDSTCCPVRYDCNIKASGKSSQESRYRKTANKHFLRMSQRLQRNRGCMVGRQFYVEGQKMKSDADRPCDICFCIRGARRCAPKKCAPALKNCMPVVPKGQCCPSSYDCGSQRDYRRAEASRQFNLFSLIFGPEEGEAEDGNATNMAAQYAHDRQPFGAAAKQETPPSAVAPVATTTSEKSIFDTLREGLEFIDQNNQLLQDDIVDLPNYAQTTMKPSVSSTSTEVSLLDLLLGSAEQEEPERISTEATVEEKTTSSSTVSSVSWVDLLLGPDEDDEDESAAGSTTESAEDSSSSTYTPDKYDTTTNIERSADDFEDFSESGEIQVGEFGSPNEVTNKELTQTDDTTTQLSSTLDEGLTESTLEGMTERTELLSTTAINTTTRPQQHPQTDEKHHHHGKKPVESKEGLQQQEQQLHKTVRPEKPEKDTASEKPGNSGLLSALLDGITGMLKNEKLSNKMAERAKPNSTSHQKPMTNNTLGSSGTHSLPLFKPLPTHRTHIRINSKIANLTSEPFMLATPTTTISTTQQLENSTVRPPASVQHLRGTTTAPTTALSVSGTSSGTTTTSAPTKQTTPESFAPKVPLAIITLSSTTAKPDYLKTNPTILEAEPLDVSNDPTLPPSLPNLKIIPFLPTDAVQAARKQPLYEFYHSISKSDTVPSSAGSSAAPALLVNGRWDAVADKIAKIEYADAYDEGKMYPSITEPYQTYPEFADGGKAEYIYKFNIEGPLPQHDGTSGSSTPSALFGKFDFGGGQQMVSNGGFSPPTKTEGGFVPKDPVVIEDHSNPLASERYQATPHIIDITTSEPMKESSTKVIEITTPDPFKDVIKTEPPPDLSSLIEDKEKILSAQKKYSAVLNTTEKNEELIVHITTDVPPSGNTSMLDSNPERFNASSATTLDDIILQDKNSIETFLDLLFKEDELAPIANGYSPTVTKAAATAAAATATTTKTTTTKTPPFKALPQITIATNFSAVHNINQTIESKPLAMSGVTSTTQKSFTTSARTKSKPKVSTIKPPSGVLSSMDPTNPSSLKQPQSNTNNLTTTKTPVTLKMPTTTTLQTIPRRAAITTTTSSTRRPLLKAPFDKLPFMDASFQVRPNAASAGPHPKPNGFLDLVHNKNSLNRIEGLEPTYSELDSSTSKQHLERHTSAATTSLLSTISVMESPSKMINTSLSTSAHAQHSATNSLIDPSGILKLAGCNIYGRMYRVGRIILELSSDCLECKCTEVGVKCGTLDC